MPKLINNQTKQLEDVSYDVLPQALSQGTHNMQPGQRFNLLDKEGEPVNFAAEDLYKATQEGYRFPSQEHVDSQLREQDLESKFGEGTGNSVKALLAGAARGASFGLSDVALTQSGAVSPETLQQLKQRHGTASTVGQIGGATAGLLMGTGEAGLGLETLNATGQMAKTALGIAENPIVRGALGKYGAAALGSGIEGAAYGAGNIVSEAALGDPSLNAEKALTEVGLSALLGGAVGGAFSVASDALPEAVIKAKELFSKTKDSAMDFAVKATSKVSGKPVDEILSALKTQGDILEPEAAKKTFKELASSLQDQHSTVNKALKETIKDIRPSETRQFVDATHLPAAQKEAERIFGLTESAIQEIKSNPELYPQRFAAELNKRRDILLKADFNDAASIHENFNGFKQLLDEVLNYDKLPVGADMRGMQTFQGIRDEVRSALENPAVFGEAGSRQAAFNESTAQFLATQKQLQKDLMVKRFDAPGRPRYVVDPKKIATAMRDPEKFALLERYQDQSRSLLDEIQKSYDSVPGKSFDRTAAKELLGKNTQLQDVLSRNQAAHENMQAIQSASHGLSGGDLATYAAGSMLGPIGKLGAVGYTALKDAGTMVQRLAAMDRMFTKITNKIGVAAKDIFIPARAGAAMPLIPLLTRSEYDKKATMLDKANNPELLISKLESATRGISSAAPQTAASLSESTSRALAFLNSKRPNTQPAGPLDAQPPVSAAELAKFSRYYNAVKDPTSVLADIKHGTLHPDSVEAVKAVYPKLYDQMSNAMMDSLTTHMSKKNSKPIPLATKNAISLYTGSPMVASLQPAHMVKMQQSLTGSAIEANAAGAALKAPKTTLGGLKSLQSSNLMQTPMQRSAHRR